MIKFFLREQWLRISFISVVSALGGFANVALIGLITSFVTVGDNLVQWVIIYGVALVFMIAAYFVAEFFITRLNGNIISIIREDLAGRIAQLDYEKLQAIGGHKLYTTLTTDIGTIGNFMAMFPMLVYNFAAVVFCLVFLGILSVPLMLVYVAFLVLCVVVFYFVITNRSAPKFAELRDTEDTLFNCYNGIIEGFTELHYNRKRRKKFYTHNLANASASYQNRFLAARVYIMISNSWGLGILFLAIGCILWLSHTYAILPLDKNLQVIMVILYLAGPVEVLMQSVDEMQQAFVALNRLNTLELHTGESQSFGSDQYSSGEGSAEQKQFNLIQLKDITYSYYDKNTNERAFTVGPISLTLERGTVTYFVGGNGSGKSTLAKVIGGLYRPHSGQILLDGCALDDFNFDRYKNLFSVVFPDYYLFDEIIRKNGKPIADEEVRSMIARLGLDDKVTIEKGKLSTINLSAGQKKRLALLLAYFDDAEVYIFDEWAAEQDPEFREYFYRELLPAFKAKGKTQIVITHDDRYFHLADKLYKFESGQLANAGVIANDASVQKIAAGQCYADPNSVSA